VTSAGEGGSTPFRNPLTAIFYGMKNFISVRIHKCDSKKARHSFLHDLRKRIPSYAEKNYTGERVTVLVQPDGKPNDWRREQEEMYVAVKNKKLRKDTPWGLSGIVTFGEDVNPQGEQLRQFDERAKQLVARIADELGVKIRYLVRHNDESHIHYHFMLDYVKKDGSSTLHKDLKRDFYRRLQDMAANVFSDLGLRRGQSKQEKLAFVDELKQTGIFDDKLIKRIRRDILYSKRSLSELHSSMEEDLRKRKLAEQTLKKILDGKDVCKEELALVVSELAKEDVNRARDFLRKFEELQKSKRFMKGLENEIAFTADYFSRIKKALDEGKPLPLVKMPERLEKDEKALKIIKRLRAYAIRYNKLLKEEKIISEKVKKLEVQKQRLLKTLERLRKVVPEAQEFIFRLAQASYDEEQEFYHEPGQ